MSNFISRNIIYSLVIVCTTIFVNSSAWADLKQALAAVENKDFVAAYQQFKLLAAEGDMEAQHNLAILYKQGKGVLQDKKVAAEWFRKAADQGLSDAQYQLAQMYDKGEGVEQSFQYAAAWYRKAAEQGNPWAQTNLGVLYAQGQGVRQDLVLAYVWLNLAASQGLGIALDNRELLAGHMSEEMLERVREISRRYFRQYVEPYLDSSAPNLRRGLPRHRHPGGLQAPKSNHP